MLRSIRDATYETDTTVTGSLDASDVASSDYEVTGSAAVTVMLTTEGELSGYMMSAEDESWSVEVEFEDIGEDPDR